MDIDSCTKNDFQDIFADIFFSTFFFKKFNSKKK